MEAEILIGPKLKLNGTPQEIVQKMCNQDFGINDKEEYMNEVSNRLRIVHAEEIQFMEGDFEGFLRELERVEFIKIST